MEKKWIQIHPSDTVAVALTPLPKGEIIDTVQGAFSLQEEISQGHKFALQPMEAGDLAMKYGQPIGMMKTGVNPGQWVHTHNLKTRLDDLLEYEYHPDIHSLPSQQEQTFMGYRRAGGKAGIRNEIWIVPTVGCVNNVAQALEKAGQFLAKGPVEAVCAFTHPYGCSQMGEDQENTRKILADLICHPNAGGVLVLGLGCENSNISILKNYLEDWDPKRVRFLQTQDVEDEMEEGLKLLEELALEMQEDHREPIGVSKLVIGLKCGGSDGLSGITANPVVGAFSDRLVAQGGTTILTEVPEMFGAETLLMDRAASKEIFRQTVDLINDFKDYYKRHNQTIYENPSPGNKEGGISTLEDKSMGCTQKSGSAPVEGVLQYGQPATKPGLNLLSAPGNDLVASTALAASGAQMVLFTTGRGTPFASPVPTMKISSNSSLAAHKSNWIDFDCGRLVKDKTLDELSAELFEEVLEVANGKKVASERAGFHDMAIFKQGVTL